MDHHERENELATTLNGRLVPLANRAGLTQGEALARALGLSKQSGYNILAGKRVSLRVLVSSSRHFGASTDYLLRLTDDPTPAPRPDPNAATAHRAIDIAMDAAARVTRPAGSPRPGKPPGK